MSKIYVPDLDDYSCVYMYSNNVLRAYKSQPANNSNSDYVDYMVDNHYLFREGNQSWSSYSSLPSCLSSSVLTDDFYYRTDFTDILLGFLVMCIFIFFIPIKIFSKLFKRGGL